MTFFFLQHMYVYIQTSNISFNQQFLLQYYVNIHSNNIRKKIHNLIFIFFIFNSMFTFSNSRMIDTRIINDLVEQFSRTAFKFKTTIHDYIVRRQFSEARRVSLVRLPRVYSYYPEQSVNPISRLLKWSAQGAMSTHCFRPARLVGG